MKLLEKIDFLPNHQKAYIFYANRFLYVLEKKYRNKTCLEPHETYVLFRMFFSQVNNKWKFFHPGGPLNDALPGPYVKVRVTRSALIAHQYTYVTPRSTAGLLFPSQCLSGTILLSLYLMEWDWWFSRAGPMPFYWPSCSIPTIVFYYFLFLFFLSIGWYCVTGVFGLIGCISLSLSLALLTSFNNNNNNLPWCR